MLWLRENNEAGLRALLRKTVPPGIYEHWKSTEERPMFYAVLGVGFDTRPADKRTHAPAVRYYALYGERAGEDANRDLFDPDEGFLTPIYRPNNPGRPYVGPRFRLIRRHARAEMMIVADMFLKHRGTIKVKTRSDYLQAFQLIGSSEPSVRFE